MEQHTLIHGGDWAGFEEAYGVAPLDFSANISPLGVPAGVRTAIAQAAQHADRYPDPLCRALCKKIAAHESVAAEHCLCGNGAADLIFRAVLAKKPQTALVTAPTFAEYETALATVGCRVRHWTLYPEQAFRLDSSILSDIDEQVDMVFLCEPNNPTGVTSDRDLLLRILARCEQVDALLVVDECFNDFLDDPEAHTLKQSLPHSKHLLILKAFTKLYAMAGVRLGYCLCANRQLLERMRHAGQPWAVSSLAQEAGIAALDETDYVQQVRTMVSSERPRMLRALRAMGLTVLPGEANYLLFRARPKLMLRLAKYGIMIRSCANYDGLGEEWYRTAVKSPPENDKMLFALQEVLQ